MLDNIKEKLKDKISDSVVSAFVALVILIFGYVAPKVVPNLSAILSNEVLLTLLGLSLLVNILLLLVVLSFRKKLSLRARFGILWDGELTPYCPSCKNALGQYASYMYAYGFKCVSCNKVIHLQNKSGANITWEEAEKALKA